MQDVHGQFMRMLSDLKKNILISEERNPDKEKKLLKHGSAYDLILYAQLEIGDRWPEAENRIICDELGVMYVLNIIQKRWPELENYILKAFEYGNIQDAADYAMEYINRFLTNKKFKIEDRSWPEVESVIINKLKKEKRGEKPIIGFAFNYMNAMNRRIPEIESFISKISKFESGVYKDLNSFESALIDALIYATKNNIKFPELETLLLRYYKKYGVYNHSTLFIRTLKYAKKFIGRWPDLEKEIFSQGDTDTMVSYARIMGDRFPDLESKIIKSPLSSIDYARDVLKGRWPKAEPRIFSKPGTKEQYEDLFCKKCEGNGHEEISGGDKVECEKCFGSGFDPEKLKEWEQEEED